MLYHMVKYGNISGSQAMAIICNNIGGEKAEDVLSLVLNQLVPVIIKKFLPLDQLESVNQKMFDATWEILNAQEHALSTAQMLVTAIIGFSSEGKSAQKLIEWFNQGFCGKKEFELTLKQKHAIVTEISSSIEITKQQKDLMLTKLEEEKSDMLSNTKAYCKAANPDPKSKKEIWDGLFATTFDKESLLDHENLCDGLWHRNQLSLMEGFADHFFTQIESACESKARNLSEHVYYGLAPTHDTSDAGIKRFSDF